MPSDHPVQSEQAAPDSKKSEQAKPIKVRALGRGYFGGILRDRGDVFELASAQELGVWMEPADAYSSKALQSKIDAYREKGVSAPKPPVDYTKVAPTPATRRK